MASFAILNRDWQVRVHRPLSLSLGLSVSWQSGEHTTKGEVDRGECYWSSLESIANVEFVEHDFSALDELSEVHKSDYLRWDLLHEQGGIWSDNDILYMRPVDQVFFNIAKKQKLFVDGFEIELDPENLSEVLCVSCMGTGQVYNSIGFLMSAPGSRVFGDLVKFKERLLENSTQGNVSSAYQSLGRELLDKMVSLDSFVADTPYYMTPLSDEYNTAIFGAKASFSSSKRIPLQNAINLPMDVVYPYADFNIIQVLHPNRYTNYLMTERTIGIHWYGGHSKVGKFMRDLTEENLGELDECILLDAVRDFVEGNKEYLFAPHA